MKKIIILNALLAVSLNAFAYTASTTMGDAEYFNDGTSAQTLGDTTYYSDGTRATTMGDTTYYNHY